MLSLSLQSTMLPSWIVLCSIIGLLMFLANTIYNLYFHPLAHIPGPLFARASEIPSWYYAYRGTRHIWLWQQFQVYGNKVRAGPNIVVFNSPEAYADIYSMKSNARRSHFYTAWRRDEQDKTTINTVDDAEHKRKRKLLNLSFTERSIRAASSFIIQNVDRWNQLLVEDGNTGWTSPVDFSKKVEDLTFDIMGELCFGKSFDVKEPGENLLKSMAQDSKTYMHFWYPVTRSPFLNLVLWLKPRGLDRLLGMMTPPAVRQYYQFVHESAAGRIALHKEQAGKPENERRQDIFYFLCEARDDAGRPAYDEATLHAEANMLIVAGSDTTSISLAGLFFYLTDDPRRCQKLTDEIRSTFQSADEIVHGPKLHACEYLKACIDEAMRLTPVAPSEFPREVNPGGITIEGEYFPPGIIVGIPPWVASRNEEIYGDVNVFRPERWIVDEAAGTTKEALSRMQSHFHPFSSGTGNCVGQNLAMTEMMITTARTLYRLDVRRAPGSTVGGGSEKLGWGARDKKQFQLLDAFIGLRRGPEVQFRKRTV
ncbi:benzoate 4-monooxygenase cytochrome P450 [Jackrogersella minutella]|nr:benzoate 4-monooxygenase cytochrome P450 [Jackrogersella minutella]